MKEFTSGAKSSEQKPRYDLCPQAAFRRWAQRMAEGAKSHGDRNYQKGASDPVFRLDRINHLLEHAHKFAEGDRSEDHLAAVMANAGMLIWFDEQDAKGFDDARAETQPCRCGKQVTRPEQCPGLPCPFPQPQGDGDGEPFSSGPTGRDGA
jgi:hypothetical protein